MLDALTTSAPATRAGIEDLAAKYDRVRRFTEQLTEPLETEDCVVQTSVECSPTKWHLAHTTWFFETFILSRDKGYQPFHPTYGYLFNSYYNTIGERAARDKRGMMSRPTMDEVLEYRSYVDKAMRKTIGALPNNVLPILELGLNHEQQHQELLITDVKTVLAMNPLRPIYNQSKPASGKLIAQEWLEFDEQIAEIGTNGPGFFFDNEGPKHRVYLNAFKLSNRLVTCGEYKEFIADGGYTNPLLWLSDGWATVLAQSWYAPKYWEQIEGEWWHHTLHGFEPVRDDEPVTHISHYEADAYATWRGMRLPTEFEWELAAKDFTPRANFVDDAHYHPSLETESNLFGNVWQWTRSAYLPYPGFKVADGAIGEYNGKFMSNQIVLRGGSCATPRDHIRTTYRNFFPPDARWQFSGIRLAQ